MSESISARATAIFADPLNEKLIGRLRGEANVNLIEFPFFSPAPVASDDQTESAIANLSQFDWLVFPDVYAVEFFLERLAAGGIDFFALDDLRVCAAGEAVADRLRFVQLHADVIPTRVDAPGILSAVGDYLSSDEREFENLRILLPKEAASVSPLSRALGEKGSQVTELSAYSLQTVGGAGKGLSRLEALLAGGAIDEFVFASPAEVSNLEIIFRRELKDLLTDARVLASDEITFQSLVERGLRPLYFPKK